MPQMPAVEGESGDAAVKPDRPAEKLFVFVRVHGRRVGNFHPFGLNARVDEMTGAGDRRGEGAVHILPAVMFGPVWLPA